MAKFTLNDETTINTYGFRILNAGINLERFLKNPVMLDEHKQSTENVIGKWINVFVEGVKLTAESDFDVKDEETKVIAGKVERGYIKGCSMGIIFDTKDMRIGNDGIYDLVKCELLEVSICAIPSNANSLSLYSQDGIKISEKELHLKLSHLKKSDSTLQLQLIQILELQPGSTDEDILQAVKELKNKDSKTNTDKVEELLTLAVNEYNLDATEKQFWKYAALNDYDAVKKILLSPNKKRTSLSKKINNSSSKNSKKDRSQWTLEDYRIGDPKALQANPELFDKLLKAEHQK
jgi:HK97 family phage prohead protease